MLERLWRPLRGFFLVKDKDTGSSKGYVYCVYQASGASFPGVGMENVSPVEFPTKVVCLTEVVTSYELREDEEYNDILEDMREEGGPFSFSGLEAFEQRYGSFASGASDASFSCEEEARMKIYSVSTRCYFAFGALVSEEMSEKLKALEKVRWVLPDSYLDVRNKDYGGEPFINGQAVPYDPKYHEEWIKNNARANERSRRNDRPRNNDRSRNFERRRENQQSRDFQSPMPNRSIEGPPGAPPNGGMPPRGNFQNTNMPPNPNAPNSPQYMGGGQPHPNMQYNAPNPTMQYNAPNPNNQYNAPNPNPNPNNQYNAPNPNNQYNAPNPNMQYNPPNMGGMPPRNTGYPNNAPNAGNMLNQDYQHAPNGGGAPYQSREAPGAMPNRGFQNNDYAPGGNMGGPPSGNRGFQNNDYAPGGNMGGPPSGNQ